MPPPLTPTLVFDIETIPDVAGIRRVNALPAALGDGDVLDWALQQRRAAAGNDFLPFHLQRVVAIACALREGETFRVWSLGESGDPEPELIRRFFDGIDRYAPQLVSWNGGGFDLPVLHHRSLIHGVTAPRYWDWGDDDRDYRYNNYLSRFHTRHLDLMDVLAGFQNRAWAPLDEIARLCGLPGKLGMDGAQVWPAWKRGEIDAIRSYCETDVANTYLLFQRFQLIRGLLNPDAYAKEMELFRTWLSAQAAPHWKEFATAWK
jgi:predicted PolB exonuclease-like 3'-5' exonuclease